MLCVYIINIFIYSGTSSVLGSVPVRFGYFGHKNIGTIKVFEGIGPVPVSGILVRFRLFCPGLGSPHLHYAFTQANMSKGRRRNKVISE